MDFVIVTFQPDIKLLRHCLASYDLYYQDKDHLYIFASHTDKPLLDQISIPDNAKILYREDYPDLQDVAASNQAAYLKLISYQVVTTEFFCIIDSDFLFIGPTYDQDFFHEGKPLWFYRAPIENEPPVSTRDAAQRFVGERIDYIFMDRPQYVFKRSIAAHLVSCYSPLNIPRHEFIVYGWFAHKYHEDEYCFIRSDKDDINSIAGLVNQTPPNYLHLDPACFYEQFKDYKIVVFWSHWELADEKMIEFFEDSQRIYFGAVVKKADGSSLMCIVDPDNIGQGTYRYFEGVYTDGWVKEVVRFALKSPPDWRSAVIEFMIPENPNNQIWELSGEMRINNSITGETFNLGKGLNKLPVNFPILENESVMKIELRFGRGFFYTNNSDRREFRARLLAIRKEEV